MKKNSINTNKKAGNSAQVNEVFRPRIPVAQFIQESMNVCNWSIADKDLLVKAGLNWKLVEELPAKIDALRLSEARWKLNFKDFRLSQVENVLIRLEALQLESNLIHNLHFALSGNEKELVRLRTIAKRKANSYLVTNLIALVRLAEKNKAALESKGFDFNLLDEIRIKSSELSKSIAKAETAIKGSNSSYEQRNKDYCELNRNIIEIRTTGQFVFWRNPGHRKGYISDYYRKLRTEKKKRTLKLPTLVSH